MNNKRILITGASGFVGSFLVEEALKHDLEVWAGVRESSSLRYLSADKIRLIVLDLSSEQHIVDAFGDLQFDYVVHAAALTKSLDDRQFFRVNTDGTQNLVRALHATQQHLQRFVFISSLSVFGPVREQEPYTEIQLSDTPQPNTAYGESKLMAERWLKEQQWLPLVILRPTGVYGPREKDYMMMVNSICYHVDIAAGFTRQDITFVYVRDVVQAVFLALEKNESIGKSFFLSDGEVYSSKDFSDLVIKELGVRHVLRLTLPLLVLRLICYVCNILAHITGEVTTLNTDHYNIMAQRNWRCDISETRSVLGYEPQWTLEKGVSEMLEKFKVKG